MTASDDFRSAAESLPQLVWLARADGSIEYFNGPWLRYTGLTVERMKESGIKGVVHPDELELTWQRWNEALKTRKPYEMEYRLRSAADGSYRWFIARAVPLIDQQGNLTRWVGTATDIDAQKRAFANLRFVLEASEALEGVQELQTICDTLANLAIKRICDWCFVALREPEGKYRILSTAHRDPERLRAYERYRARYPQAEGEALERALNSNVPVLLPIVRADDFEDVVADQRQRRLLEALHMHSVMAVPLAMASGEVHGAIAFVTSQSARSFTHEDLEVAQMVAARGAAAIHAAQVLEQERRTSQQLRFLARAGEMLFESFDIQTAFDRITELIVSGIADFAAVMRIEKGDALRTVSVAHRNPQKLAFAEHLRGERTLKPHAEEQAIRMLAQHRPSVANDSDPELVAANMWDYLLPDVKALDVKSVVTVPLHSRGETYGALVAYWAESGHRYTEADLPIFTDLGRRISIAVDHADTLARERRISGSLQRALLPQPGMLPQGNGLSFSADYRPSSIEAEIGGDWYDALALDDGSIVLTVGDVTGRGLQAAGLMGKLRQAMAIVPLYERDPSRALDAVDFLFRRRASTSFATAFLAIMDPQQRTMRFANAGHPPPLLRRSGEIVELRSEGLPLGLRDSSISSETREISLEGAEMLILYTDGLIEGTHDIAFGETRLRELAASDAILNVRDAASFLCDACLPPDAQDDTAVLAVQFGSQKRWQFDAENAQAAQNARGEFVATLRQQAEPWADVSAAELVFGELIGNVVRHAPGPIDVQVDWSRPHPVLHVIDRGHGFVRDAALPADPFSEYGRGLYIVSKFARRVRFERIAGYGNHVAVELSLRRRA